MLDCYSRHDFIMLQNSLALVNAAIRCTVDPQTFIVSGQPVISIGGISGAFVCIHFSVVCENIIINFV